MQQQFNSCTITAFFRGWLTAAWKTGGVFCTASQGSTGVKGYMYVKDVDFNKLCPCKNKCVITCVITCVILSVITHVIFYKKCESH